MAADILGTDADCVHCRAKLSFRTAELGGPIPDHLGRLVQIDAAALPRPPQSRLAKPLSVRVPRERATLPYLGYGGQELIQADRFGQMGVKSSPLAAQTIHRPGSARQPNELALGKVPA